MRLSLFQSLRAHLLPWRVSRAIPGLTSDSSFAQRPARSDAHSHHVCVIGAGFAGLACAYELTLHGYRVTVIEPRDHVGGRVRTLHDFVKGKHVEAGAELVGTNHTTWLRMARDLGLTLVPVPPEVLAAPVYLNGKTLPPKRAANVLRQAEELLQRLNPLARRVDADHPWRSPNAEALDHMTLANWIAMQTDMPPIVRHLAQAKWEGKNALPAERQSLLAFLAMVKGGGVEHFWADSESLRCTEGNQSLAIKLANVIGTEHLILNDAVTAVAQDDTGVSVTTRSGRVIHADDVVLTAPPSVWPKIKFTPELPKDFAPQMGMAVKYMAHVGRAFWQDSKLSPESTTDDLLTHTWDGTPGQPGKGEVLQSFVGGDMAMRAHDLPATERHAAYTRLLESLYPGYTNHRRKARFVDWIADPHSRGGYSFPAPGEVTRLGPTLESGIGHLHFAGEYASYAFIGYMEGALRTGVNVARKISLRDGVINEPLIAA